MSGIATALCLRGRAHDTNVVVWGGDGSTFDIGFAGVSAAAERNEDVSYVLNDNEAYMNTGVQKSGATPEGAWTTTIAAGSLPLLRDLRAKVERATALDGFRFLHVLGRCPPGWRITHRPKHPVPVAEYLALQGRFAHLHATQIALIQQHVDERWELLEELAAAGTRA